MKKNAGPVHLAGSVLGHSRHVCAFFRVDTAAAEAEGRLEVRRWQEAYLQSLLT